MEKILYKYHLFFVPLVFVSLIVLASCSKDESSVEPKYNSPSGVWNIHFHWNSGDTTGGQYDFKDNGNVDCVGDVCTESHNGYTFVSRTFSVSGNGVYIVLKYYDSNQNNALVTGNIFGTLNNNTHISGTLDYTPGNKGTWTADKVNLDFKK